MIIQVNNKYCVLSGHSKVADFGFRKSNDKVLLSLAGRVVEVDPSEVTQVNDTVFDPPPTAQELFDAMSSGLFATAPTGPYLELSFSNFSNFPYTNGAVTVTAPSDLTNWNLLWGSTYTDVVVDSVGFTVKFYGDVDAMPTFQNLGRLLSVTDTGTVENFPALAFSGCNALSNIITAASFNIDNFGPSQGDDDCFSGLSGKTISITIPASLMETNGPGLPDGDIEALITNNTVTVNTF